MNPALQDINILLKYSGQVSR